MIRRFLLVLSAASILAATGCKPAESEQAGYKKEDFSARPAPAGFGPGGRAGATPPPSATTSG